MKIDKYPADYLIVGGGIVGLTIARQLRISKGKDANIVLLEKEPAIGLHSSGRNSGVMHSGIYYPAQSLKAKVCGAGAREMVTWCKERNLPVLPLGKVLVPVREEDGPQIDLLLDRAQQNGVKASKIDAKQLSELEPEARSATGEAIWVPATSVIDPKAVLKTLVSELESENINILTDALFLSVDRENQEVSTPQGRIRYRHLINCAGLHADTVAHAFGVGSQYTILPFKGLYWKLDKKSGLNIRHLIYPVPDLRVPFLGVHTTTSIDGTIYIGPTAVPAWGRENYRGHEGIQLKEIGKILYHLGCQYIDDKQGFRLLATQEGRRYFKRWFAEAAQGILPRLITRHLLPCDKVGIRAQILDTSKGELVTDFLIKRGEQETHILNAISPAFTSAFPFARYLVDNYING